MTEERIDPVASMRRQAARRLQHENANMDKVLGPSGFTRVRTVADFNDGTRFTTCRRCGAVVLIVPGAAGSEGVQQHWNRHHPIKTWARILRARYAVWQEARK